MYYKKALTLFMGLCLHIYAWAQCNHELHASVKDKNSGQAMPFVSVLLVGSNQGASTNEAGVFHFDKLCKGNYKVVLSHIGCETDTFQVTLPLEEDLVLYLTHDIHDLEEVRVVAGKSISSDRTVKTSQYPISKINANLGLAGVAKNALGVAVQSSGSNVGKPIVNGASGSRVGVMQGETMLAYQQWGDEHAPQSDPFSAKSIHVIKGGEAIQFGAQAASGLIKIEYPNLFEIDHEISGSIGLASSINTLGGLTSAEVKGALPFYEPLKIRVQGSTYKYADTQTPDYKLNNTASIGQSMLWQMAHRIKKHQLEAVYTFNNDKKGVYSGAHIGNLTDLESVLNKETPPETGDNDFFVGYPQQRVYHEYFQLKDEILLGEDRLSIVLARQFNNRKEFDKHPPRGTSEYRPAMEMMLTHWSSRINYSKKLSRKFQNLTGVTSTFERNANAYARFIPEYEQFNIAAYSSVSYAYQKLGAHAGIRYEHYNLTPTITDTKFAALDSIANSGNQLTGNIGVNYYGKKLTYKLNSSTSYRPPSPNELYSRGLHHSAAIVETGNPNLKAESGWNNHLSVGGEITPNVWVSFEGFYQYYSNYIEKVTDGETELTIRGAFPSFYFTQHKASFAGINGLALWEVSTKLEASVKFQTLWAKNQDTDEYMARMPADRIGVQLKYKPSFNKWFPKINVETTYVTRQRKAPADQDFIGPPADYTLLEAGLFWEFGDEKPLTISMSATNLTNKLYYDYNNSLRYYMPERGQNISISIQKLF